mmetsp:Transcript_28380/g.59295  ORF Transcript_28380/g.59295 Transcript_28380/m.59295 type:complete len:140 (+) Transcript_28380:709-1128(+)
MFCIWCRSPNPSRQEARKRCGNWGLWSPSSIAASGKCAKKGDSRCCSCRRFFNGSYVVQVNDMNLLDPDIILQGSTTCAPHMNGMDCGCDVIRRAFTTIYSASSSIEEPLSHHDMFECAGCNRPTREIDSNSLFPKARK